MRHSVTVRGPARPHMQCGEYWIQYTDCHAGRSHTVGWHVFVVPINLGCRLVYQGAM